MYFIEHIYLERNTYILLNDRKKLKVMILLWREEYVLCIYVERKISCYIVWGINKNSCE